jgi:hypothetical protein
VTAQQTPDEPQGLQEALSYFSDQDNCVKYLASRRWPDGIVRCPTCDSTSVRFLASRRLWECRNSHARKQFSVRVGTIFAESHIGLCQWLITLWMIANPEARMSSYKLARRIGVTQKSAWFMLRRIQYALRILQGHQEAFSGS